MKNKVLLSLLVGGCLLCITGCGTDQLQERKEYGEGYEILKCDLEEDSEEKEELTGSYLQVVRDTNASKIVETSLNLEFDYSDALKDDKSGVVKKTMHSSLNLMCDAFEKEGYLDCYYSAKDYLYTLTLGMDLDKILDEDDKEFNKSSSLEDIKDMLENQNELKVSNCNIK